MTPINPGLKSASKSFRSSACSNVELPLWPIPFNKPKLSLHQLSTLRSLRPKIQSLSTSLFARERLDIAQSCDYATSRLQSTSPISELFARLCGSAGHHSSSITDFLSLVVYDIAATSLATRKRLTQLDLPSVKAPTVPVDKQRPSLTTFCFYCLTILQHTA